MLQGQGECREAQVLKGSRCRFKQVLKGSRADSRLLAWERPAVLPAPLASLQALDKNLIAIAGGWVEGGIRLGLLLLARFLGVSAPSFFLLLSGPASASPRSKQAEHWRGAPTLPSYPPALLPEGCSLLWIFLRSGLAVPLNSSQEALTPKSICGRPCLQGGMPSKGIRLVTHQIHR